MVRQPTCPICKTQMATAIAADSTFFPFCSERCRNVDLLRWSDGRYAIVESLDPAQIPELLETDDSLGFEAE
jgi:endogenous inhibitor of DNA gyrase (YacG/DUF329 family)